MYREKNKLIFKRIFWLLISIFAFFIPIIPEEIPIENYDSFDLVIVCHSAGFIGIIFFINALSLSCQRFYYDGREIIVYAGTFHHYIKIDGEKCDEHNTLSGLIPIFLSTRLEDDTFIECTISTFNRIALKIDGKLYRNKKKIYKNSKKR